MEPEIVVHRQYFNGKILTKEESESQPLISPRAYPPGVQVGHATVGGRITINLGNYESVQLYVEVSVPAMIEELSEAYEVAHSFVERKLGTQKEAIESYKKSR